MSVLIQRCAVRSVVLHNARQTVALLLICIAVGAGLACQVHTRVHDHGHALPSTSHHSSSPHSLLDFSCMTAVLPTLVIFASLFSGVFYATPRVLKHTGLVFPPFVPPRHLSR
jgi:hypothetical protein